MERDELAKVGRETPNVLVIFCDQLRIDLLGCYGDSTVRTPNIDALAADSVVFDRCYTPIALCSPARASLMTGLYPHSHHMFNNSTPPYSYCERPRADITMIQDWIADDTNYVSAYFGKWHIGEASVLFESSFDQTHRPWPGCPEFLNNSHWHPSPSMGGLVQPAAGGKAGLLGAPMEEFPDVVAARYTTDFLRTQSESDAPFAAFCAFPGPHSPWMIPEEYGLKYRPEEIPLWSNRHDTFEGKPLYQQKLRRLAAAKTDSARADAELRELLAHCFSYLELIDIQVGEIVATLKELDLYDSTAIIFTADHGDMAGSHGFPSKGAYMYDEIYRIPLIYKAPGREHRGDRYDQPVHLMDITATVMHLMAGVEQTRLGSHPLHGKSFLPILDSTTGEWYKSVHFAEYHGDWYGHYTARMVTDGTWKLVWNLGDLCELYDLKNDPDELINRFYDPAVAATRDRYLEELFREAERFDDGQLRLWNTSIESETFSTAGP